MPLALSTLEVIQICPSQWKALLATIGGIDPYESNLICFDLENHVLRLPHQIAFLIEVIINEKTIHRIIIDEGASTCIMYVSCWKVIGSPTLNQSPNTLGAFYGHDSRPFGVLPNISITLEGKTLHVEVENVDENINYNILLGRGWSHVVHVVASSLFCMLHFPHQGKIIIVD